MAVATAALIGGALAAGGSIASAAIGSKAAKKAAKTQAESAQAGIDIQREQFEESRADLAPWRQVGEQALNQYAQVLGLQGGGEGGLGGPDFSSFFKSPGYEFRLGEGVKAVERSAAARGSLQSGATMKAIQRYGEGLASQEYGRYIESLSGLAGMGLGAAGQTGAFGAAAAGAQAQGLQTAGEARASGFTGSAGAIQQGIGGALGGIQSIFKPTQVSAAPVNLSPVPDLVGGLGPRLMVGG